MGTRFQIIKPLSLAALVAVAGCQGAGPRAQMGGLGGAAAGGLLAASGHRPSTEGIIAGVLLGGLIGSAIGDSLDHRDRQEAQGAAYRALENSRSGDASAWKNPDSGHYGSVTPVRTYQRNGGEYCREYQQSINVGGQVHQGYGTACRQPDGSWKIVQ
jgi:surface antigen